MLVADPLWYKDAIIYELHVKCFHDSNGDGIGDFRGLTQKLDYLADLGVTAIWLLPFYPSPLRDDGYDIADFMRVNPDYGTMRDFKTFLREAHRRGLRVITELVVNHTSDQHAWFQRARRAKPGSAHRDYYVWSDTPEKYKDARIIFKDFEPSNWSWDPVAKAYYWHRFYHHQPDLNYEHPQVRKEVIRVLDFWMGMGVDGMRLDAVPYLFEEEGTNCENLPRTYELLKELRAHIDANHTGKMLLAEANQWPEDAAAYFGGGKACHMCFHFPLMPRMFMSLQMEDRFPIVDILDQTPAIPENCQWALFLRNHDELTLEMVTDEERDYMYRMYARDPRARINLGIRRRLAPLLENNRRKIELMNVMLLSMPGATVLYYGDEIGMGDNYYLGDRDGVRTPMQWSGDRNAGFSAANPQRLYLPVIIDPEYHFETVNVETQDRNQSSLLWWTKNAIGLRKRFKAFSRGTMEFVTSGNTKVLAYLRSYAPPDGASREEHVLVVINLSRHPQSADLDLHAFAGWVPEDVFSRNRFPVLRETPTHVMLNSHGYYLFELVPETDLVPDGHAMPGECPGLGLGGFLDAQARARLEEVNLPDYLRRRGFLDEGGPGGGHRLRSLGILETVPVGSQDHPSWLFVTRASHVDGPPLMYNLLASFAFDAKAEAMVREHPQQVICRYTAEGRPAVVFEGLVEDELCSGLLELITRRMRIKGRTGEIVALTGRVHRLRADACGGLAPSMRLSQRTNTLVLFGEEAMLKIFRRAEEGTNPDLEIVRYLTEEAGFTGTPAFLGAIQYQRSGSEPVTVAVLKRFVKAESDAWQLCHGAVSRYLERVLALRAEVDAPPAVPSSAAQAVDLRQEPWFADLFAASDTELVALMGRRTAELHLALARPSDDPAFSPEPFSLLYQRSVFQAMQSRIKKVLDRAQGMLRALPEDFAGRLNQILARRKEILGRMRSFYQHKIRCLKTRVHGDYHLLHLLYTGKDFVVIDFEGKPYRPLAQRRIKRSPFRDVADLQRSLFQVAHETLLTTNLVRPEDREGLQAWADLWHAHAFGTFLRSYFETAGDAAIVPESREDVNVMLDAYLLEKSFDELGRALDSGSALREGDPATEMALHSIALIMDF